jgi:L-amino acid N-acyltransferase
MIRDADERDLEAILDIYNDAILHTTAVYHETAHTLDDRAAWYKEKRTHGYPVIVWEEKGRIAGFASFGEFRPFHGYRYTVEHSIYVHPNAQGRGIGVKLLERLIQIAQACKYKLMIAVIDASNHASIGMHVRLGFQYAGTLEKVGYKFGRWLDVVYYQLELPGPDHD